MPLRVRTPPQLIEKFLHITRIIVNASFRKYPELWDILEIERPLFWGIEADHYDQNVLARVESSLRLFT
jgi:hypothetical protein